MPNGKKPFVGQIFGSIDFTFKFYMEYGRICGFDCRRSTERKDKKWEHYREILFVFKGKKFW